MEERRRDYKTALQELVQRQADQVLTYHMTGEAGPDHDKTFQAEVQLNGLPIGAGSGHSKKEAEQAAAKRAGDAGGDVNRLRPLHTNEQTGLNGRSVFAFLRAMRKYDWNFQPGRDILKHVCAILNDWGIESIVFAVIHPAGPDPGPGGVPAHLQFRPSGHCGALPGPGGRSGDAGLF